MPAKAKDPAAYLAALDHAQRATLEKVRQGIRAAAPTATEGISYGVPAFLQGKAIAGYSAGAEFCSYYPMSGDIIKALAADLKGYPTNKGAIRFPIGKPLPAALIRKLVKARLAEIAANAKPKASRARATPTSVKARSGKQSDEAVVSYLRSFDHPLKTEIEAVRLILLGVAPKITEGIKWNVPSFRTTEWFATFNVRAKDSVQLVFHLGAKVRAGQKQPEIRDPKGLMKWLGPDRAMVSLGAGRDVAANRKAFEAIVRAWLKHV